MKDCEHRGVRREAEVVLITVLCIVQSITFSTSDQCALCIRSVHVLQSYARVMLLHHRLGCSDGISSTAGLCSTCLMLQGRTDTPILLPIQGSKCTVPGSWAVLNVAPLPPGPALQPSLFWCPSCLSSFTSATQALLLSGMDCWGLPHITHSLGGRSQLGASTTAQDKPQENSKGKVQKG